MARAVHRDMLTLFEHLLEVEGKPATEDDLRVAHTSDYVTRVRARCEEAVRVGSVLPLQGEVMVSGGTWDAVTAAVGSVLTGVELVGAAAVNNAFCAVRPPGHGAGAAAAGQFGIFNGVAVAALRLAEGAHGRRVLVVEWGSHAGRGTAEILRDRPGIVLLSLHAAGKAALSAAPGRVVRALAPNSGGDVLLAALRDGLREVEDGPAPDFVLLSLGCDALTGDPLGELGLEPLDYFYLTAELRVWAEERCGGRLVSVLEEGYDAQAMGRAVVQHLRALAALAPAES